MMLTTSFKTLNDIKRLSTKAQGATK